MSKEKTYEQKKAAYKIITRLYPEFDAFMDRIIQEHEEREEQKLLGELFVCGVEYWLVDDHPEDEEESE